MRLFIAIQLNDEMKNALQDMQAYYQDRDIVRQKRYLGNVGEMLTALYFAYHKDKWRTDFTDYKLLE